MTRIATMGTSSCATIAMAGFKGQHYEMNEKYLADPSSFVEPQNSVQQFYSNILYPTSQPLGHTDEYPLEALMKSLDNSSMKTKFVIATLNQTQRNMKDNYWPKQLAKWGFVLSYATKNTIGQNCFVYIRNPNAIPFEPDVI